MREKEEPRKSEFWSDRETKGTGLCMSNVRREDAFWVESSARWLNKQDESRKRSRLETKIQGSKII